MKRKKSIMWNYFRPTSDNMASCNLCQHSLSYKTTTTNLKKHIERRHPAVWSTITYNSFTNSDAEFLKGEHPNIEVEEVLDEEESILIEYSDDRGNQVKKHISPKPLPLTRKILRIPVSKDTEPIEKTQPEKKKDDLNSKFSNLANSRNELIKIELEAAKKDLELKEWQLACARREEERRQREHEINMKIKEAELQNILSQQIK